MTDLEALECIVVDLTPKAKEHNKEEIEQVRKSLEVLEILKNKNIEMELLKNCIKLPDGIIRYNKIWAVSDNSMVVYKDKYLENKEFNKLKEWLENE